MRKGANPPGPLPCLLYVIASVFAALESPPHGLSAKYVPFSTDKQLEEEYSLDEVIYRSQGGERGVEKSTRTHPIGKTKWEADPRAPGSWHRCERWRVPGLGGLVCLEI